MKTRICSVLPRKSLHTLAHFEHPPQPSARAANAHILSTGRLPTEAAFSVAVAGPSFARTLASSSVSRTANNPLNCAASLIHDRPHRSKRPRLQCQLHVGAYGIPKQCASILHPHTIDSAPLAVQVGEDAYFVRENAMGIADGVGGWARSQHTNSHSPSPSALFASHLMHYCSAQLHQAEKDAEALQHELDELEEGIDVLMILDHAYQRTVSAHTQPPEPHSQPAPLHAGSSTALLAVLDHVPHPPEFTPLDYPVPQPPPPPPTNPVAVIKIAHVGDCMAMLVRDKEIVWRSEEMWWDFNTPVQLGPHTAPATLPTFSLNSSFTHTDHTPIASIGLSSTPTPLSFLHTLPRTHPPPVPVPVHTFTLPVQPDDILILASDGLSDNLWDEDVVDELTKFSLPDDMKTSMLKRKVFAGMLSEALCSRARSAAERRKEQRRESIDADAEVPFARRAREAGRSFRGGKCDDISVVVAVISPLDEVLKNGAVEQC